MAYVKRKYMKKRPVVKRAGRKKTYAGRSVRTGNTTRRSTGRESGRKTRTLRTRRKMRKR